MDDVHCSGTEATLQQCTGLAGPEQENCSPSEGVFLVCGTDHCPPPPPLIGGEHQGIRLTNPSAPASPYGATEGILEASTDGVTWGPVCDDYFDQDGNAAEVVCRQLGFFPQAGSFGHCDTLVSDTNFVLDDVICESPTAHNLMGCQYQMTHNCGSAEGIWVNCASASCANAEAAQASMVVPDVPVPPVAAMRLVEPETGRPVQDSMHTGVLQAQIGKHTSNVSTTT